MERRFSSQRKGGCDRTNGSLLQRLPGRAAGIHLSPEMGLPLPGAMVRMAGETAGRPGIRTSAESICEFPSKSRSGCELVMRFSASEIDEPGPAASIDGAAVAWAGNTNAVSRPGVRGYNSIFIFCGSQAGAR